MSIGTSLKFARAIEALEDREQDRRLAVQYEEEIQRDRQWDCPSCLENPPRKSYSRLAMSLKFKGELAMKRHLVVHKFESMRRHLIHDAIILEEKIMRKKLCEESEEFQFHIVLFREYGERLLLGHGKFVAKCISEASNFVMDKWEKLNQQVDEHYEEILQAHLNLEERVRMGKQEQEERELISISCNFTSVFAYQFVGSPTEDMPFEAFNDDFYCCCGEKTLQQQFNARFAEHAKIVHEEPRDLDFVSEKDKKLPRGINRFNLDQLLEDSDMEDEQSFLPIARNTNSNDATAGSPPSSSSSPLSPTYVAFGKTHAQLLEENAKRDRAQLAQAKMQLRSRINRFTQAEEIRRSRIENHEEERRKRAALSFSNLYGIERGSTATSRARLALRYFLENEVRQRENIFQVEILSFERISRLFSESPLYSFLLRLSRAAASSSSSYSSSCSSHVLHPHRPSSSLSASSSSASVRQERQQQQQQQQTEERASFANNYHSMSWKELQLYKRTTSASNADAVLESFAQRHQERKIIMKEQEVKERDEYFTKLATAAAASATVPVVETRDDINDRDYYYNSKKNSRRPSSVLSHQQQQQQQEQRTRPHPFIHLENQVNFMMQQVKQRKLELVEQLCTLSGRPVGGNTSCSNSTTTSNRRRRTKPPYSSHSPHSHHELKDHKHHLLMDRHEEDQDEEEKEEEEAAAPTEESERGERRRIQQKLDSLVVSVRQPTRPSSAMLLRNNQQPHQHHQQQQHIRKRLF